ncbi:hypothetical protein AVEN_168127-1 [Araneus ventricosus]|uniref:DUF4817 domain-containing protein n=1 Tax=Araneus ventricosus TaxID=182803 RepID=A0A4Y2PXW8_ARAVE|nr:hypothetical protein AVEN_168127-1 [Araneus ventricosus]
MTRCIYSPSLKDCLVARDLARWQACSGTVQDGDNSGEEFLYVGICEVFFGCERSACISFLRKYEKAAPGHQSILRWFCLFRGTGCLCKGKSTGQRRVSEEIVELGRQGFVRSPKKINRLCKP